MMRSLYSGVAGLRTHQTKMDVLGNNIANVNTTSFKSQSITFSDLMYQTTQSASGATETKGGVNARQIGLGAKSGAIATAIESQGATQTTNNPFDIMITGKSFFVVNNGKENLYTRDGSFYVDGAGNLAMQSNGYFVMGWTAQEDPETGEISVNKNGGLSQLQVMSADNYTYSPASTTAALFSGNIDDNDTNIVSDDGKTITLEFYDNKGYLYTGKFTLKDTGTDDLFSLQLTDILDSTGTSIGKTLLDGVTFGSTKASDPIESNDSYTVSVNETTNVATVTLNPGATAYTKVPLTGTLKNLMESSNTTSKGVLKDAYVLTDADIEGKAYDSSATYSIDSDTGVLTISWSQTDYNENKASGFNHSANITSSYYYDSSTGIGYKVPSNMTQANYDSLSTYDIATFTNVFGITPASGNTYSFDGTTLNVYPEIALEEKTTATSIDVSDLQNYYSNFTGDLESSVSGQTTVYYTYNGTDLVVYEASTVSTDEQDEKNTTNTINADTSLLQNADGSKIAKAGEKYDVSDLASYVDENSEDYTKLQEIINENGYTKLAFAAITGTAGVVFYKTTSSTSPSSNILYSGSLNSTQTATASDSYSKMVASSFSEAFTNGTAGYDYLLTGSESAVSSYSESFLSTVFGMTAAQYNAYADSTVAISATGGTLTVKHTETETHNPNEAGSTVEPSYDSSTGTMNFVTTTSQTKWTIPSASMTGNITDLLSTSTGTYSGLLSKVYSISDADARAYGTDGTYAIDTDGNITLTTGSKTVTLKFNPANGSLVAANGETDTDGEWTKNTGLVNLVFDQSVPGLEAFGYQKQATDDDDVVAGHLTVDFSTVTNYNTSGTATIKVVKGDKSSLNTGRMVGEMNGITVSTDGQIHATYSNGQTKLLGQIASAEFANASGLSKEGDNLYASTLNSGEATIQDITVDGGYMNTGVLEMSNVDLSKEFTEMITTQRGFQANSRIITVSDTLLEELTNLKR
ncbi:MAG: flagellar hook-basal body complex protein [Butyrivibrio sp.]|nr:flagellar hook-basal body complex protein [Butyrivibrio sp.]